MDYLLIFNIDGKRNAVFTKHATEALENARKGDMINLYHYDDYYNTDEYRVVKMISYNGNVKHIHLQDKE